MFRSLLNSSWRNSTTLLHRSIILEFLIFQICALSFNVEDDEDNDDDGSDEADEKPDIKPNLDTLPVLNDRIDDDSGCTALLTIKKEEIDEKPIVRKWMTEDDVGGNLRKKVRKNPDVDTSFLPDREREESENRLREELRQEWVGQQATLKDQEITITFSYWDGSGHRRSVSMKKGNSIYQFLQRCLEVLRKEFSELKTVMADQLMYVKEDLILPHHYTFYDFIVTKARGKSGPLFQFDVHDDIRMTSDASVEKEESHAGKVLLRSWYERNKHIFPASRWEPYDPTKIYDKYTIKDKKK